MQRIYVIHENPQWIAPLGKALDELELPWSEWPATDNAVFFDQIPPEGIFYNRVGASSYLRGNQHAPEYTDLTLCWLAGHGRRIINGINALRLEISKIAQYAALKQAGITTPHTTAILGNENVLKTVKDFGKGPYILKPNRGGMGAGVKYFQNIDEIATFLQRPDEPKPIDDVWLLQEYIENPEGYITRCEFVGGQFLYATRVDTRDGFELCPAGICNLETRNKFTILQNFKNERLIQAYQQFLQQSKIDTAGIEFITDRFGNTYTYDVNVNTNYNQQAEVAAGIKLTGMKAIANFLATGLYSNYYQSMANYHPVRLCV